MILTRETLRSGMNDLHDYKDGPPSMDDVRNTLTAAGIENENEALTALMLQFGPRAALVVLGIYLAKQASDA